MSKPVENAILTKTPVPSEWMTEEGKIHFRYIMPKLIADGVVCSVDVPVIEAASELFAVFQNDETKLADRKSAIAAYISIMASFGVTYKARKALTISKADKKDEVDETFGGVFD